MKKILLTLILCLCFSLNVKAKELPTFVVGSSNANKGDEIIIPISIKNNVGFAFIGFKLTFDTNSLEYIDGTIKNLDEFEIKQVTLNNKKKIVFYAITLSSDKMMKDDKQLLELKFKVLKEAQNSDLKLAVTDYGDSDLNQFKFKVENGKVNILNDAIVGNTENLNNDQEEDVTWESSDNNIAVIDEYGNVTFKDTGEVTITKKNNKGKIIDSKIYNVKEKEIKEVKVVNNKEKTTNIHLLIIIIIISLFILLIGIAFIIRLILKRRTTKNN